jgi:hypothetical protein
MPGNTILKDMADIELVHAEGTSHNAYALVATADLQTELASRQRALLRYGMFAARRDGQRTAVTSSPEARNYLQEIASVSRLRLLARAMPWARACGRPRVETHHFAMPQSVRPPHERGGERDL